MDIVYRAFAVEPFRFPGLMWVDDTIVLLERGDSRPIQGVPLDQRTYYQGILRVDVPDRKIQHGSTSDPQPVGRPRQLPWPAICAAVGNRYPGPAAGGTSRGPGNTTFQGPPLHGDGHIPSRHAHSPQNLPGFRAAIRKQLRPPRLSPDAAIMVLMAKLPSKLLSLASVYRPTAQVHAANDALMVRAYKRVTGISRHAHTDALSGPSEHGCHG